MREERQTIAGQRRVVRRYLAHGEQQIAYDANGTPTVTNLCYTRDHLGSVRELIDADGVTIRARYDYDSWGRRVKLSGGLGTDRAFTGHFLHAQTGLHLTRWRAYDAGLGRWLSRDPIGEKGGSNLYWYVDNSPVKLVDPDGLDPRVVLFDPNYAGKIDRRLYENAMKTNIMSGAFYLFSHSSGRTFGQYTVEGSWVSYSAREIALLIRLNEDWVPGMRVIIIGCNSASGDNPIAQQLADELGAETYGANDFMWNQGEGGWIVAGRNFVDGQRVPLRGPLDTLIRFSPR